MLIVIDFSDNRQYIWLIVEFVEAGSLPPCARRN